MSLYQKRVNEFERKNITTIYVKKLLKINNTQIKEQKLEYLIDAKKEEIKINRLSNTILREQTEKENIIKQFSNTINEIFNTYYHEKSNNYEKNYKH